MSKVAVPPPISWAQRNNLLFVIVNVECKDVDYKFTDDSMHFKGTAVIDNKDHEVTLSFLKKIKPNEVTCKNTSRCMEFVIPKDESGPYWSKLTTDKNKPHFLKVDFNKWKDDDGSDNEDGDNNPNQNALLSDLLNMQGAGDGKPAFDDFDDDEKDSDDENIPQLSSEDDEKKAEK